jgi:hypothetical protein
LKKQAVNHAHGVDDVSTADRTFCEAFPCEKQLILDVLQHFDGNRKRASDYLLGLSVDDT